MSVASGSAFGAYICSFFALVGSMIKLIAFIALQDWFVFFNVYVIRGDNLREELEAGVFCVVSLLFARKPNFDHVCLGDYVEVVNINRVFVGDFSYEVFLVFLQQIVINSSGKNCPGRYALLGLQELITFQF